MSTEFNGDNKKLIASINALLALDAKGCLAPHGIGEYARVLLQTCEARLPEQHQGEPVALPARRSHPPRDPDFYARGWNACLDELAKLGPLYTHQAPAVQKRYASRESAEKHDGTTLAVLTLGAFDSSELGDIDIQVRMENAEALQQKLVGAEDIHVDLVSAEWARGLEQEVEDCWGTIDKMHMQALGAEDRAKEIADLRTQLAERDALLTDARALARFTLPEAWHARYDALPASAEPSARATFIDLIEDAEAEARRMVEQEGRTPRQAFPTDMALRNSVLTLEALSHAAVRPASAEPGAPVELTDVEIFEAMRPALRDADGGYVVDMAQESVIKAGRDLLARLGRGLKTTAPQAEVSRPIPDFQSNDAEPDVTIIGCSFNGCNTDGTPPFTYERRANGLLNLTEINLVGWTCYGPSAGPITPKCETCKGHGVIGWQRGQTPEQFEQGEDECGDCLGTGHAHSQGMAVPGTCTTCDGKGHVPDGAITGVGGVEFENGPVECIKDCPDCAPVERDEQAEFAAFMHEVVAVTEHDGRQVKVQRQQYTSRSEEEFGWKAWQARAALERKPSDDIPDFTPGNGNRA